MTTLADSVPADALGTPAHTIDVLLPAQKPALSHVHLTAIDGIRGLAILMVLCHHMFLHANAGYFLLRLTNYVMGAGSIGVDLFFVLSGFLITGILVDSREKSHYFRNFYMRRTVRIFPLYYACLLIGLLLLPAITSTVAGMSTQPLQNPAWLFLYATNFWISAHHDWNIGSPFLTMSQFWSLAVEEHFYLVWPLIVFLLPRRQLIWTAVALFIAVGIARGVWVATTHDLFSTYVLTPFRLDGMLVGAVIAVLYRSSRGRQLLSAYSKWIFLVAGVCVGVIVAATRMNPTTWLVAVPGYPLIALFFGGFVGMTVVQPFHSRWNRTLSTPILRFLGKYSYGIYVFHLMALSIAHNIDFRDWLLVHVRSHTLADYGAQILPVLTSIGVAWLSWHLYEKHFLRLKKYFPS